MQRKLKARQDLEAITDKHVVTPNELNLIIDSPKGSNPVSRLDATTQSEIRRLFNALTNN
jgi:hypothetical protein